MNVIDDIKAATLKVTKKWTAQRKREERQTRARHYRDDFMDSDRTSQAEVAEQVIPRAYRDVSDNGRLPAHARQIYYAARAQIEIMSDRRLESVYFTQTLLPRYLNRHPEAADWWVVYDARGHLIEPHTGKEIPLGTLAVDKYLGDINEHHVDGWDREKLFDRSYPTCGPSNRYSAILFVEKEGFNELFAEVKLAERFDLAIMSTKGQTVVAARRLVDEQCAGNVPVLVLHDLDKEGFLISQRLTTVSDSARWKDRVRYEFQNSVNVIDLGLRLSDVKEWDLESEFVTFRGRFDSDTIATPEEQRFLRENQRVELNAFTSADFITWIESKLAAHGIQKVVPDTETLQDAFRRAWQIAEVNSRIGDIFAEAAAAAENASIPDDLEGRIRAAQRDAPEQPWDEALAGIVQAAVDANQNGGIGRDLAC